MDANESLRLSQDAMSYPELLEHEDLLHAAEYAKAIRAVIRMADKKFDPIIEKTKSAHDEAKKQKDSIVKPLQEAYDHIRVNIIGSYIAKLRQLEASTLSGASLIPKSDEAGGVRIKTTLKYKIVAVDEINWEFLTPDWKAISKEVLRAGKKAEETVGGIEVYSEDVVSVFGD